MRVAFSRSCHPPRRLTMPQGSKSKYTSKQKRKAEHIAEGYEKRGTGQKEAKRRAWATVNKESGGGEKSGSGRGKEAKKSAAKKGGRKGGKKAAKSRKKGSTSRKKGATSRKKGAKSPKKGGGRKKK